ncbi:MAG TPA: EAL domain-containing protein, partial [Lachnospiraceae bacterium]|nr:EAL domain-containing protein [Lachnospiraceae bacterium]
KIDMEFFRNFDERGRKIIRSVVMMAKSLGIQTLAEGVEDAQQLEFLKSIDCG